jgi:signal transduction histidine kinase
VRAHGGELSLAESRPEWTCFKVTLPRDSGDV